MPDEQHAATGSGSDGTTAAPPATAPTASSGDGQNAVTPASPASPAVTAGQEPSEPPAEQWDHERGMATITKLRAELREAKKAGTELTTLRQQLEALENEKLTEQQRVERERDQLLEQKTVWEREKRDTTLRLAVYGLQAELGIADSDLAIAALDASQVEYDQTTGQPTNLAELLTDLLEKKPILKAAEGTRRAPSADGGKGATPTPPPSLTAEEIDAANQFGISPERYALMKGVTNHDEFRELRKREQAASTST